MADAKSILTPVLDKIAEDEKYEDYNKEISPIESGGANYMSKLYKITLTAPNKDPLELFAKVAATSEKFRSMINMKGFETEIAMYTKIFTKYKEYEEIYNFPTEDRLVLPKYYGGSTVLMQETVVLQELTSKGFEPFDRFKCYDWEYASKSISILATFHALSVRYQKDNEQELEDMLAKIGFQLPMNDMKDFMEQRVMSAIAVTADEHKGRLGKFVQESMTPENFMTYFNPKNKVVLAHADFRPSNTMYKRDENGKLVISVIDHQALQKWNPVSDVMYFYITGSDEEFRKNHFKQYFDHYYDELCRILRLLEINPDDVYTRAEFDEDVKTMLPFGIVIAMMSLPFITVDTANAPNLDDGIDLQSFAVDFSDLFKTRFNGLVKDYVDMGLL